MDLLIKINYFTINYELGIGSRKLTMQTHLKYPERLAGLLCTTFNKI